MQIIDGKKYYKVDEAAKCAGVSVRTLRRWISADRLSDFLFPFRVTPNAILYRMEPPDENDSRNEKGEWVPGSSVPVKGGASDESGSGS